MNYDWYFVFNKAEFEALELGSKSYPVLLDGRGEKVVLVTQGNALGVTVDEVFLIVQFNDNNPYVKDGIAVYLDENDDVHIGFELEN